MSNFMSHTISLYDKIDRLKPKAAIPLDIFLENIRDGKWEDIVHRIRAIKDKKQRDEIKTQIAPYVTVSGIFTERTDKGLEKHSGFIAIDIDNLKNPEETKEVIIQDKYVAAAFTSISGNGLCVLFKVVPEKHREAFQGISEYLYSQYKLICDPTSINVSRARFISWDPNIFIADQAVETFRLYPKAKPPKKIEKVIYAKDDFEQILKQIMERRLNICEDYHTWLRICFSLVWKFGEAGREYFHLISQYSSKYEPTMCDKQFDNCLKHKDASKEATISTFYYYAKQSGCDIYSNRTRLIAFTAATGKKEGLNERQVADNLRNFEGIEDAEDVIKQVFESGIELNEDNLIEQLEIFIRQNYVLQRNEITRYIENNGTPMQQKDMNTIYIRAKKLFEKLTYEIFDRLINSDFVPTYNPILKWFTDNMELLEEPGVVDGSIEKILSSIIADDKEFVQHFGKKWFVSAISAIHGEHSPLMFVLSGEKQATGKTEFFRRMLPKELRTYYAESKLDAGKDDEILMTQKWFIMDDEMGGKSKKEIKRLKELTSKQTFSLREPYGRNNVDLNRIAVLCGTTNDNEILSDPTGNRRIIPVHVKGIDHEIYNSVDKVKLWMEAYKLWKEGFNWKVEKEEIDKLHAVSPEFEMTVAESELILKYFQPEGSDKMTATDVKVFIEGKTQQKLSLDRIAKELKRLGFAQKLYRVGDSTKRMYALTIINSVQVAEEVKENIPDPFPAIKQEVKQVPQEVPQVEEFEVELSEIKDAEYDGDGLPF